MITIVSIEDESLGFGEEVFVLEEEDVAGVAVGGELVLCAVEVL